MADPPGKKVFSLFQPRTKPAQGGGSLDTSIAAPLAPSTSDSTALPNPTSSSTASSTLAKSKTRPLTTTASRDSDCITLNSSDDENSSSTINSIPRSTTRKSMQAKKKVEKGKGKAKAIIVDTEDEDEEDDDLVVVGGSQAKVKKGKGVKQGKAVKGKEKKKKSSRETDSIDLTVSPVRPTSRSSFPASRPSSTSFAPLSEVYRHDRERRKAQEGMEARWPTAEEHGEARVETSKSSRAGDWVDKPRYGQTIREAGEAGLEKVGAEGPDGFFHQFERSLESTPSASKQSSTVTYKSLPIASTSSLIPAYPSHPLLDRLASQLKHSPPISRSKPDRTPDSELWTTTYGPRAAEEILGSESGASALILKDWLNEMKVAGGNEEVTGTKRRRPVSRGIDRKQKKKKKRRPADLDDFLASSSSEGEGDNDLEAELANLASQDGLEDDDDDSQPSLFPNRSPSSTFRKLTNLILLVGPHGSGKTAAVQAAARQLGFEIFEVNAGAGKRRAKDLETEVGDVGRNHIVRASPRKAGAKDFFAQFKPAPMSKGNDGPSNGTLKGPTQSLILIEEVDVLFHDEIDFWTGIRALSAESRRPIVLTCTDTSQVPFDTLGLQKIHISDLDPQTSLEFAPPEPSLAVPFLQLVSLSEGHLIEDSSVLADLYERRTKSEPNPSWLVRNDRDRPLPHPFSSGTVASMDLRRSLMQLQFELQRTPEESSPKGVTDDGTIHWTIGAIGSNERDVSVLARFEGEDWLERAVVAADSLSFADAEVARKVEARLEDLDTGFFTTSADEEISPIVLDPFPRSNSIQFAYLGKEPEMSATIEEMAYQLYPTAPRFTDLDDEELEANKSNYLHPLAMLSTQFYYNAEDSTYLPLAPILPRPSLVTDYLPLLRHITSMDDRRERFAHEAGTADGDEGFAGGGTSSGVRRSTRRAGGQGPIKIHRRIEWRDEDDIRWIRSSGFKVEEKEEEQ